MGWACTAGDRRSGPVPTAERLDHPDPPPLSRPGRPVQPLLDPVTIPIRGVRRGDDRATPPPSPRVTDTEPEPRPAWPRRPAGRFPGDHTGGAPPVPIPNTAVKPARPMIVPQA